MLSFTGVHHASRNATSRRNPFSAHNFQSAKQKRELDCGQGLQAGAYETLDARCGTKRPRPATLHAMRHPTSLAEHRC
jgi:hypothetical protein